MHKLRRIRLGHPLPLIRLLHKILVPLLIRKLNRVFFGVEVKVGALHEVARGLPAHERVLPAVAFGEDVPVHAPLVTVPVAGLLGGLRGAVDAVKRKEDVRRVWGGCSGAEEGSGEAYRTVRA